MWGGWDERWHEGGEEDRDGESERYRERVRKTNSEQNCFACCRHAVVFHFIERHRMNSPQNSRRKEHRMLHPHPADGIDKSSGWMLWVASDCSLHQHGGASHLFCRHSGDLARLMDAYCLHMKSSYTIIRTQFICKRAVTSKLYSFLYSRMQTF